MATALIEQPNQLADLWAEVRAAAFAPPPLLTVSQCADQDRIVPSYSAEPGRWVTEKTPYLREIMDCFSDPAINRVVFMKCARIGATEAGINVIYYFSKQDPSPIFIVQPTVDDAKDFSKEQLTPSIEETDTWRALISDARSRDSGNTILAKLFPGGALYLVGANSPRGFRRRTARVVVLEEVDGYPPSAGTEGDQVKLAERRATTFQHRRKIYINSTPTLKGYSRIEKEFAQSDQRRYFVACVACGAEQFFEWSQLKWDDGRPDTAAYCCKSCGVLIDEREKFGMVASGKWVATNPGQKTAGFHINALYSPWISWAELVEEWMAAQGDVEKLQVFVNTALGETWEDRGGGLDPESLFKNRRESYTDVPAAVGLLTAGVDVQADRLEVIIRGWGHGEESWLIARVFIHGDPTGDEVWRALDEVLGREYPREGGGSLRIHTTCVDSGYEQIAVLSYCGPRFRRRIFAVKGGSNHAAPFLPKRPSRTNKLRCPLYLLGTNAAKSSIYGRLKIVGAPPDAPTRAAYKYHFNLTCDRDYFEQLTAAKAVKQQIARLWTVVYETPDHKRDEVLDCEVYALAALYLSNVPREKLGVMAERARAKAEGEQQTAAEPHSPAPTEHTDALSEHDLPTLPEPPKRKWMPGRRSGGGFTGGWR